MMMEQIANRYEILSLIGQGGMADVYKAKDTILNRIVAIKVLRDKLSQDAMALVRFQREASAASRLSHPNVVDIYDVGEYEGMHYIVMEFIRGRTLKELIAQRGALDVDEAIGIMKQLVSAINHAHENNIIHRDIKPQNVLVKDDGTIKITDFGIAVANGSVQLTFNNTVMGSAHYLAPETTQGKEPNEQVDIYSLGIVFYELLTGKVPFTGKTPTEIAIKHLRKPMPFVRDFNPNIPQSVENIILKATAKNLSQRYVSCKEMLYDLIHCLDPEYRDMKRIKVDQNPSKELVKYDNGHLDFEEDKPERNDKKKRNWIPVLMTTAAIVIGIVVLVLIASITGIIKISGFLGYQTMPNVIGQTQEEAIDTLQDAHFNTSKVSYIYKANDKYEEGTIIKSSYKDGDVILNDSKIVLNEETVEIEDALKAWTKRYGEIYPMIVDEGKETLETPLNDVEVPMSKVVVEKPKVIIPIFPGQNCEFDTTAKFERAGAEVKQVVFNNLTVENIQKSIETLAEEISSAQILMIVGGFSSGDEPDGSGKFIANVLRNPKIAQAIDTMRANDGLILGICNGFQALIKSGLLPYGDIEKLDAENPTLFRNNINRHVSHIARTRITSNASPWLAGMKAGNVYSVAVSHGEGKFVASEEVLNKLIENGQVATQYVNEKGVPTMDGKDNLNGSSMAIEGIFSEDGKIFGKMGHSERYERGLFQNIAGNKDQDIFANGVRYFTHKQVK